MSIANVTLKVHSNTFGQILYKIISDKEKGNETSCMSLQSNQMS